MIYQIIKLSYTIDDCCSVFIAIYILRLVFDLFLYNEIITILPKEEKYNAGSQIRRAVFSITANIAEGYGRYHYQEGIQFYRIARASLYELKDHLISCHDLNFISDELYQHGINLIESAKTTLNGYIKYVKNRIK